MAHVIDSRQAGRHGAVRIGRAAAMVAALTLMLAGCDNPETHDQADPDVAAAVAAGKEFLDRYVDPDGRVVRRDQGNDTVSEGQAYGMLVALAIGDGDRFVRIWRWTREHLARPDGLLSWRWAGGRVVDANSAADADLDAARALVMAGQRHADPTLRDDGLRLARAILDHETVTTTAGRLLTAGSWATRPPYPINPSYQSPRAVDLLRAATGDERYDQLRTGSHVVVQAVVAAAALPPDWASAHPDGTISASAAPDGTPAAFGLDAARLPIRLAESCDTADRSAVARLQRPLAARADPAIGVSALDGRPVVSWRHPVALIAGAAAVNDPAAARPILDQADAVHGEHPTYYGAAWVALGRIMLTTSLLDGCPPAGAR